ncbi:MAG TPA: rhomboid family intramembrane serine protease [Xanthobacteraceae bacterium]
MRDRRSLRHIGLVSLGLLVLLAIFLFSLALILTLAPWLAAEHARILAQRATAAGVMLIAAAWCTQFVVALARTKRMSDPPATLAANIAVLAIGGIALQWFASTAGLVVAGAYAILVALPYELLAVARRRAQMRRHEAAIFYGRLAGLLQPSRRLRSWVAYQRANLHGTVVAKIDALRRQRLDAPPDEVARLDATGFVVEDEWERALACAQADTGVSLKALEVRSFGELGRLDEMLRVLATAGAALIGLDLTMCRLYALAFVGRPAAVTSLLAQELADMAPDRKAYWSAIALRYSPAGVEDGRRALAEFAATTTDETARRAAQRHLAASRVEAAVSAETLGLIAAVEQNVLPFRRRKGPEYPITLIALCLGLLGCIVVQLHGAAYDPKALVELGALTAPLVLQDHQWWRLATAPLLHDGWVHGGLSLYLLLMFGVHCERKLSPGQIALVYAIGTLVSVTTALFTLAPGSETAMFIGASGSVFASAGGLAAAGLLARLRSYEPSGRRGSASLVRQILLAICIAFFLSADLAFEINVLGVSYAVHLASFLAGFAVTLALLWRDGPAIYVPTAWQRR